MHRITALISAILAKVAARAACDPASYFFPHATHFLGVR